MASKMMYCAVFLVCAVWIHSSAGSAIPMWEYLSRGEKVNRDCPTNDAALVILLSPRWAHPATDDDHSTPELTNYMYP